MQAEFCVGGTPPPASALTISCTTYIRLVLPPPPPPPEMHPAAEPNILCELRSADWKLDSQPTTRSKNGHKEERVLSQWARRGGEGGSMSLIYARPLICRRGSFDQSAEVWDELTHHR